MSDLKKTLNLKLDDLMNRGSEELEALFIGGETPTIEEINGPTRGRVLSGKVLGLSSQNLRQVYNLPWLPWMGKAFSPISSQAGEGKNRLRFGFFKPQMFRFETRILPPMMGTKDVFSLNYDLPENPWFIRQIRDDVKRVGPGLYLGTANFKWKGNHEFVLYFGLELLNYQEKPVHLKAAS
jgi:hypothetical protein